jgi:hypothetical protein
MNFSLPPSFHPIRLSPLGPKGGGYRKQEKGDLDEGSLKIQKMRWTKMIYFRQQNRM